MQKKQIKYALKNYHKIKEYIRLELLELEAIQCKMEGTGGGSIIQCDERGIEIPQDRTPLLLDLIDRKDEINKKISRYTYDLKLVKAFVNSSRATLAKW